MQLNINKLFCDTIFSFYNDFKKKNIEPDIQVTDEQLQILCNEAAIKRILQNVLKNVLEHGENDIKICLKKEENKAVMTFSNRFENADTIDIEQIFDRFYKADRARNQTSAGLGLSIAKELALKMGGNISASFENDIFMIVIKFAVMPIDLAYYINDK